MGRAGDYTLLLAAFLLYALEPSSLYLSLGHCLLSIGELGYVRTSVRVSMCARACYLYACVSMHVYVQMPKHVYK